MLIGLLSDTHIPDAVLSLPPQLKDVFRDVELILHAGDIFVVDVLDELSSIAPVLAARGDSDYLETRQDKRVKERHILTIDGVTIWLCHDEQLPADETENLPDVIISGHTHWGTVRNKEGVLQVNPGSPTYPVYKYEPGTVALLRVSAGKADAEIIQLK